MRFATAQLAALAYYILSTEATFPLLGDIFDCIPHNTPPVCSELNLYHDTSASINGSQNNKNKRDVEKRTFGNFGFNSGVNAAFVVSGAKKLSDGSYGIDCNFKSDSSVQLNLAFGKKIKQLSVTGTGYSDIDLLGHVANPFEWSASFKIKAEIVKGKCCLPSGFKIITDFESNCPEFDAIKQIFGTSQIIYKVNAISHAIGTFDASALFNAQLNAFPVKRELNEFEELNNNNNGITHSKRTLGLLLNLLKKVTGGCDTLQQFCWDCQCDTPSVSTTIVSTSSAPETSTTPESSVPETTIVTTSSAPETTPESSVPETTTTTTTPESSAPVTTPESSAPETTTTTTPESSAPVTTPVSSSVDSTSVTSVPESSAPGTTPVSSSVDSTSVTSVPESSAPESSAPETETETSPIVQLSTTTAQTTTVITVTSCSNNACSKTKVTTGVVVVTSEDTIYTTFCPLTETTPVTSSVDSTAETSAPESSAPETTAETSAPESSVPETTAESTTPESSAPESTAESTTPESTAPESTVPESTAPETETSPTVQFSTTTAQTTTVLTVTSCSNNACSESEVTTGVVVITTEDTIYTTFCPLTETTTATESSTPSVETTPIAPIAPESSAPASESVPVTESSSVAPIAETTPVSPNVESTPVAPNAESTPVAPNAESTPVAETTPIAPTTAPETSAIVSTTEGTIPTTLESISIIQSSANSSYTIAPVSSFEGAGNNMRLTYGAAIVGLAALLI